MNLTQFAVAASRPDNPPINTGCAYQIPLDPQVRHPVYECLTQAQWDARQAAQAEKTAAAQHDVQLFVEWCVFNWWKIALCSVALIVVFKLIRYLWWRFGPKKEPIYMVPPYNPWDN